MNPPPLDLPGLFRAPLAGWAKPSNLRPPRDFLAQTFVASRAHSLARLVDQLGLPALAGLALGRDSLRKVRRKPDDGAWRWRNPEG